ncbi:ABC transporter substrate-binding protein [Jiangella endophytica]|uniref:ABC transporter substrate-binding protein n=1 Tax=Jiangella endophytica TaxID=1623398 RepID=UPI000E356C4E|nr:ABC transporter substrate-binding protein [Jiangella endophytica]
MRPFPTRTLAAAVTILLLSACGGTDGGEVTDPAGAGDTTPRSGGTLRYALSSAPVCPDPHQAGQNMAIYIARQVADSLTDQDPETGEIVPWLAESWEAGPAATEFTFHLRHGVTFSDGTPLTAESVRANFDAIVGLGAAAPLGNSYLAGYVETRVADDRTATVVFEQPNAQFLQATATHSLALLSDATLATPPEQRCQGGVVGSGPFVVEDYVQDQSATLVRRDGYAWGSAVFGHDGEAYLDGIEFSIVPESGVRAGGLASDQLDAISDVLPQDQPAIEGAGGQVLTTANPGVVFVLHVNVSRGPLADPAVRRALLPAIDRQQLVDTVLGANFHPATSILGHRTPGWVDLSDRLAFDPDAAAAQLDAAGWTAGADGIREKDGQPLSIDVVYGLAFNGSQAVLELVQQQLRAVGVDLRLRQTTPAESEAALSAGDYDTFYYNTTRADPDILRTAFSSTTTNRNRFPGPTPLDPVLERQAATLDAAERDQLVATAQESILDEAYAVPLFELSQAIGVTGSVRDLRFEASARLQFFDTWLAE